MCKRRDLSCALQTEPAALLLHGCCLLLHPLLLPLPPCQDCGGALLPLPPPCCSPWHIKEGMTRWKRLFL